MVQAEWAPRYTELHDFLQREQEAVRKTYRHVLEVEREVLEKIRARERTLQRREGRLLR